MSEVRWDEAGLVSMENQITAQAWGLSFICSVLI